MLDKTTFWVLAVFVAGCGGSAPAAESPDPEAPAAADPTSAEGQAPASAGEGDEAEADSDAAPKVPTQCVGGAGADPCLPDAKFAKRLCADFYPSMALYLFANGSPWSRGYATRKTKAWNASGGASEPVEIAFDEEVLILRKRSSNTGGIQVSGAGGGYDVIRWDGTCVTLGEEELTRSKPPKAKTAKVDWRELDGNIRDSLRENETVNEAYRVRRKECKGASMGTVSLKCVKADEKLSKVIVDYVRDGGKLAMPRKVP